MNRKNQFFKEIHELPLLEKLKALRLAWKGENPILSREEAYKQGQTLITRAKRAKNKTKLIPFLVERTVKPSSRVTQKQVEDFLKMHLKQDDFGNEKRKVLRLIEFFLQTKRQNLETVSEEDVNLIVPALKASDYTLYESQYDGIIHVAFRFKGQLITREAEKFIDRIMEQDKGSFRFVFSLFDEGYISNRVKRILERHAEKFIARGYGESIVHQLSVLSRQRYKELIELYQTQAPKN